MWQFSGNLNIEDPVNSGAIPPLDPLSFTILDSSSPDAPLGSEVPGGIDGGNDAQGGPTSVSNGSNSISDGDGNPDGLLDGTDEGVVSGGVTPTESTTSTAQPQQPPGGGFLFFSDVNYILLHFFNITFTCYFSILKNNDSWNTFLHF